MRKTDDNIDREAAMSKIDGVTKRYHICITFLILSIIGTVVYCIYNNGNIAYQSTEATVMIFLMILVYVSMMMTYYFSEQKGELEFIIAFGVHPDTKCRNGRSCIDNFYSGKWNELYGIIK